MAMATWSCSASPRSTLQVPVRVRCAAALIGQPTHNGRDRIESLQLHGGERPLGAVRQGQRGQRAVPVQTKALQIVGQEQVA